MEFLKLWWEKSISEPFWSFWWWFGLPRTVPEQKVKNRFFDFFEILTETKLPMKNSSARRSGRRQTCQTAKKTKKIITTFKNGSGMISVALLETYGCHGTNISKIQVSTKILACFGTIVKKNCYIVSDSMMSIRTHRIHIFEVWDHWSSARNVMIEDAISIDLVELNKEIVRRVVGLWFNELKNRGAKGSG